MTEVVIDVRQLRKSYEGVEAVKGIDLEVHRGETLAVLGPNGAGKTTLVEILAAYRPRTSGDVAVLGTDPARANQAFRTRIGIVTQHANDLLELTVNETLRHFAGYFPKPRDRAQLIGEVGLEAQAKKRVRQLSGGQRRRLDVALGVIGDPELLFLDEPTTGFDPEARQQFWELIRSLSQGGTTIVLTTHYLNEADELADRVAVINQGVIAAIGRTDDLVDSAAVTVSWRDGCQDTRQPTQLVKELAQQYGGEVPGLVVRRETLDDVYMRLIRQESQ